MESVLRTPSYCTQNSCSLSSTQALRLSLPLPRRLPTYGNFSFSGLVVALWSMASLGTSPIYQKCLYLSRPQLWTQFKFFPMGVLGPITSKRMQLDSYLSIHKHSMTLTLNSWVLIDDLWTGGRLVPHASISESQPECITLYNFGIPWSDSA